MEMGPHELEGFNGKDALDIHEMSLECGSESDGVEVKSPASCQVRELTNEKGHL